MATEALSVRVDEKGARVVRRRVEDIGKSAKGAGKEVGVLRSALRLLGGALLIREYKRLSDTFTNIQNRLKTVTSSSKELASVTEALRRVSNSTRSSFEGTAELYARMGLAAKDLGTSQQELIAFTKSLNQAVILSGASAQEAENAIIQLSQGIASGALRGDELRSVLEQLPVVADVIAKQLKVTRGELREMGKQGKITADVVLDAFKASREELENGFAKTTPTIGQALTVLRNEVIAFVGSFNQSTGAANGLASAILAIAKNVTNVGRLIIGIFNAAKVAIDAVIAGVKDLASGIADLVNVDLAGVNLSFKNVTIAAAIFIGKAIQGFRLVGEAILTGITVPINVAGLALVKLFNFLGEGLNKLIKAADDAVSFVFGKGITFDNDELKKAGLSDDQIAEINKKLEVGDLVPELSDPGFKDGITEQLGNLSDAVSDFTSSELDTITSEMVSGIEGLFAATTTTVANATGKNRVPKADGKDGKDPVQQAQELLSLGSDLNAMAALSNDQLEREVALLREIHKVDETQRLEDLARLYQEGAISAAQYVEQLELIPGKIDRVVATQDPLEQWFAALKAGALDIDNGFKEVIVSGLGELENALVDFATTGSLSFKSMVDSMLADLSRLLVRYLLFKAVVGAGFGLGGGGGGGLGNEILNPFAPGFADGGQFMVGGEPGVDRNLIAFRASQGERVTIETRAQQRQNDSGGQGGNSSERPLVINNITDPREIQAALASGAGEGAIMNTIEANADTIRRLLR